MPLPKGFRIAQRAKRKVEAVNAVARLQDLMVPPSKRLVKLCGALRDFHSIRINDSGKLFQMDRRRPSRPVYHRLPLKIKAGGRDGAQ